MTDVTLVLRRSAASAGPALRLALTSPAVAGSVTLKAVATIDPPGQAVAVWSVDGQRIGTSVWRGSGREWSTEIAATLAAGTRLVQVAYGALIASDSLTVQAAGGVARSVVLSWVFGGDPGPLGASAAPVDADDWPAGNGFGTTVPDPPIELAEASTTATGTIMAQAFLLGFGDEAHFATWDVALPAGYVNGTLSVQASGPCLILTRTGTATAGDYEVSATVDGETYGPLILRLT